MSCDKIHHSLGCSLCDYGDKPCFLPDVCERPAEDDLPCSWAPLSALAAALALALLWGALA